MKTDDLIAIDIHTHAEVSCRNPFDNYGEEYDRAADKYFGSDRRPTIDETVAYYRERKMAAVVFTVNTETALGHNPISSVEIAEGASRNNDVLIPFGSVDPLQPKKAVESAKKLIGDAGVKGFKFHPTVQNFAPNDESVFPIYEVQIGRAHV